MHTGAVICEYNPFHKGHKYLLDNMRRDGCECIVAVMSGSFTQRGDVAVYSKFSRAESALRNSADIVIELPTVWAVASAQRFAQGGCDIIKALGCVDSVYFGSESGDAELLKKAADATEDEKVNELVKELMQKGEYYPSALENAVAEIFGTELADILASPNNTLGIEYIKCLRGSNIQVKTIERTGVRHDSADIVQGFASASKIREMIAAGDECHNLLPQGSPKCLSPAFLKYGDRVLLHKLRTMSLDELSVLPDVSEGLENRILSAARSSNSSEELLSAIKTKRYTMARLRRIITCALLGIRKEHQDTPVPYVRVLGFNSTGELFLKEIKNTCPLPVIVNVADGQRTLSDSAQEIFHIDIKATDIRTIFEEIPSECGRDFTNGIIKIK